MPYYRQMSPYQKRHQHLTPDTGPMIVWCRAPAPRTVGDQPPVAVHADTVQVGSHLDPAADRGRVDRVVVGVQGT